MTKSNPGKLIKKLPYYPVLFSIYPLLHLYLRNRHEISLRDLGMPLIVTLVVSLLTYAINFVLLKEPGRAAILSTFFLSLFLTIGHALLFVAGYPMVTYGPFLVVALYLLVFVLGTLVLLKAAIPRSLTETFNLAAMVLFCFQFGQIAIHQLQGFSVSEVWQQAEQAGPTGQITQTGQTTPDIYYIILDGYGRQDVLEKVYGYDNQATLAELEARGFVVAQQSRANYLKTLFSLPSSLNLNYLDMELSKAENQNPEFLKTLTHQNFMRSYLSEAGYKIVSIQSNYKISEWEDADVYLKSNTGALNSFVKTYFLTTGAVFLPTHFIDLYRAQQDRILFAFESMETIHDIEGPKFVFAHIWAPHPPFVFDENGTRIQADRPYTGYDGSDYKGTQEEYLHGYKKQIEYIDNLLIKMVDALLSQSAQAPIIIIQADHGPGAYLEWESLSANSCLEERSGILNAYYLPEADTAALIYPEISPVNTFRVILNQYFGETFEMLPDETYFVSVVNEKISFDTITNISSLITCELP